MMSLIRAMLALFSSNCGHTGARPSRAQPRPSAGQPRRCRRPGHAGSYWARDLRPPFAVSTGSDLIIQSCPAEALGCRFVILHRPGVNQALVERDIILSHPRGSKPLLKGLPADLSTTVYRSEEHTSELQQ